MSAITAVVTNKDAFLSEWEAIAQAAPEEVGANRRVGRLINQFLREVRQNSDCSQLRQSVHGATDITLICNRHVSAANCETAQSLKFILKLIFPTLSVNTRFCSKALSLLEMMTPNIYVFDKKSQQAGTLVKVIKRNVPKHRYNVAFMQAFPGADIGHLIATRGLFKLRNEDWCRFLRTCGKIAVFDLVLGNDDRFYRPTLGKPPQDTDPFCNKGNIMLDTSIEGDYRILKHVYCIDNGSSQVLMPHNDAGFTQAQKQYLDLFIEAFIYFEKREKQTVFGEIIYKGMFDHFRSELREVKISSEAKRFFTNQSLAIQTVTEGIAEGYDYLRTVDPESHVKSLTNYVVALKADQRGEVYCNQIIHLIKSCFNHLREMS